MRKILISLSIIGVVGALAIGGTIARFYDVEVVEENVFVAGRLDLRTDGGDGVTGEMVMSNMYPGQSTGDITTVLWNTGHVDAAELSVTFRNEFDNFTAEEAEEAEVESFDGEDGDFESEMSKELIVIKWRWGDEDLLARPDECVYTFRNPWVEAADINGVHDNIITLYDLEKHSWYGGSLNPLDLSGINGRAYRNWIMNIKFDDDAPNELQGDKLTTNITFRLSQVVE